MLALASLLSVAAVTAEVVDLLTVLPPENPYVSVSHHVLSGASFDGQQWAVQNGKEVTVLCGFCNNMPPLDGSYTVSRITGSINAAEDSSIYMQNLSLSDYSVQVGGGDEFTFLYRFTPEINSHLDVNIALTVFFEDPNEGGAFSDTFFNLTAIILESDQIFDYTNLYTWLFFIGIGVALLYAGARAKEEVDKRTKRADSREQGGDVSDWVPEAKKSR